MASMTIRKKWYGKIQQISDTETRKEALWAILEYIANDNIDPLRRLPDDDRACRDLYYMVLKDVKKSRQRAEEARRRREERKKNEQNDMNRPRTSRQHIYEQHPAMFLFDGFASYMMSTAYTAGRKAISDKYGQFDFDKAINMFRKNVLERKQLTSILRFQVFRDMFSRFLALKPWGLDITAA